MKLDHDREAECPCGGMSRRGFIGALGSGVVGAAAAGGLAAATQPQAVTDRAGLREVTLRINGRIHTLLLEPRVSLLNALRDELGMTGTKQGCERGECGACTVLVDGRPRYACMTLAVEAEGCEITTIEGLMTGETLGRVQQAFVEDDALQCGYCTPGQVMAAEGLLRRIPDPTAEQIREGMSGNLCRCGAYPHIVKAVRRAAELRKAEA